MASEKLLVVLWCGELWLPHVEWVDRPRPEWRGRLGRYACTLLYSLVRSGTNPHVASCIQLDRAMKVHEGCG